MNKFKLCLAFMLAFCLISCEKLKAVNRDLNIPKDVRENIDREISEYNDNVISKIIEVRDYSFRKSSIFCTHSVIEIKNAEFEKNEAPPDYINIISNLYCAEPLNRKSNKGTILDSSSELTNLSSIPVKYTVDLSEKSKPRILGFQLPRKMPLYVHDLKLYFNQEERDKINVFKVNNAEMNRRLIEKIRRNT
jgi:hypothetical protein